MRLAFHAAVVDQRDPCMVGNSITEERARGTAGGWNSEKKEMIGKDRTG